jgi:RecA-family ATPase
MRYQSDEEAAASEVATALTSSSDTSNSSDTDTPEASARYLLDSVNVRNGTWLTGQTFEPLRYAVPGVIPEGLTFAIGPPKVGKSWLAADVLLGVASGGYVLGKIDIPEARHVLNLALEDGDRRMQSRCQQILGDGIAIPDPYHYVIKVPPGQVFAVIEAFLTLNPRTALVVLDTLGKVMPDARPGESAYARDYRIGGALKDIADRHPGLALVVIHHDRKATSDDFVEAVSGTNGLAGSADTIMVLGRKRGSADGLLKITGRDVPEAEYALKFDGIRWTLDGDNLQAAAENAHKREDAKNFSETSTSILDFVREQQKQSPAGVRAKVITDKFGPDAATYLKRQTDNGRLHKPQRGLYLVSEVSEVSEDQLSLGDSGSDEDEGVSE